MVRLLQRVYEDDGSNSGGFNPTMVRLLLRESTEPVLPHNWFQSHNGAIAAQVVCRLFRYAQSFNPTMVRLLRTPSSHTPCCRLYVSIPQWCDCCVSPLSVAMSGLTSFNPTMVRLLRHL